MKSRDDAAASWDGAAFLWGSDGATAAAAGCSDPGCAASAAAGCGCRPLNVRSIVNGCARARRVAFPPRMRQLARLQCGDPDHKTKQASQLADGKGCPANVKR